MTDAISNDPIAISMAGTYTKEQVAALLHGRDVWACEEAGETFVCGDILNANNVMVAYLLSPHTLEVWSPELGVQTFNMCDERSDTKGSGRYWLCAKGLLFEPPIEESGRWAKELRVQAKQWGDVPVVLTQQTIEDEIGERTIHAVSTTIPYAPFDLMGFGGLIGRGMVLSMEDLPS